ncbi:NAD(P)H-dependent oxidoreductase [Chitinimonas arctica]|uniref:NAD(P)H-dependent oxidoreductase n=1 Tax=Chitinimonas arctica TaxID=2594795 RepID=A0A516SJX2_9NEIS|nr:NAD(P)H-dependent oxidoreductase [Chitinimonas arctica]QDQ28444.1 NAD(P)H-dependent oxidoreductase [Chitinimonas arctica]
MSTRILVFAGSARRDSLNKRLAAALAAALSDAGAEVSLIDLADFEMPLYHGDWESAHGVPEAATRLNTLMLSHDALALASPENNASISALMKNTLDWLSRIKGGEGFAGKTALLTAASPGALGGLRGLNHLRDILHSLGVGTLPQTLAVSRAHEAFTDEGGLSNERQQGQLVQLATRLVAVASALKAA